MIDTSTHSVTIEPVDSHDAGFSGNFEYQVKVTMERPDTTDVFDTKEKALKLAQSQLKLDNVTKVAVKKVKSKDLAVDGGDVMDGL